ncbi:MAR-binding filament-like protein 1-1 [Glycine soja]|uniref:MAR-binding filament-like protein 1-1 n=1 Tax=Glycine soja TaxID=3848 RepID=A0A445HHF5_GLYSO|nr:MAR-binding filament-like protein 1-1 [Glycine soja]
MLLNSKFCLSYLCFGCLVCSKLCSFYGQKAPEVDQPSNSFLLLLNGIGVFSSGVLGALYKLAQKEKSTVVATIETVLREKEEELHQLKDQFELALGEASKSQIVIADLSQERDDLKEALDNESSKVNHLKHELQVTQENLAKSRNESAELENLLTLSNKLCKELELEVSKLSSELTEVNESLQRNLDDLTTAKEHLREAQAELQGVSKELTAALEKNDSLQKELVEVYKKAESTAEDLKEQKQLEQQVSKDKESRKSLEGDLEEATKSLDEMNRNAVILSGELQRANSLVSSLEKEKDVLIKFLNDQRNACKEAQDNIEGAHNLIMKLGKERENLEKKGKKFEEELASAKGEILCLKSRINSSKVAVNNDQVQKDGGENKVQKDGGEKKVNSSKVAVNSEQAQKDEGENKVTVSARKTVRRRKANPQ